jgi:RNA polymerase sigma factor (TIGR02999 family)
LVDPGNVTRLLQRIGAGEKAATEELFALLYGELRALAGGLFRSQKKDHTLQPTAVLHEAWLKMANAPAAYADRVHFFAVAARAMRQVLVNHARDAAAEKRGGGAERRRVTISEAAAAGGGSDPLDVIALHDALDELKALEPRQAQIAELRFFGGLTTPETAEALGVATRTVELDWKMAKDWLARRLRE